ncbi:D-alanyl-D-alanine carboxypeptidase/D-alanyl-D-alanine endopeptidase [Daejeonella lutea]|uniref:D-alanyl-D-alanine carboxypeptidase / D-alanyl-D-alanine-endopeptidase (Penicillin-binding protein 4) n=1 Tax=Daejeonella lutea TaxID=572036 RepID=A0A1T5CSA9_9SPHI|nr:D-alanyl-D-alanine carboxypeptidase/D-alanyl-D-alanine-endopeptidase [Daejeonella lutea]SKB62365.1 D-alanyl-D-alanine carboxypeptidase / D-alanyl-D-alanine-endopeptidase (penicillin-binding protein 4) [Daejeonella lutea]
MRNILCFFLILCNCNVSAQPLEQRIANAYKKFANDQQLAFGSASLTVLNAETGEVVFSENGNMGLASASTLKTITSATAYHLLGKDFTWETTLGYTGSLSADGTLNGDLIIKGSGDPSLGSDRYEQSRSEVILKRWVEAVSKTGIKKIGGRIIADDRLFGTQTMPGGWTWQDMGNYYGAGPSALTWRENQFDLIFRSGAVGQPAALVRTEPNMGYLKIVNEVTTGKSGTGDNVYAYSGPYANIIYLRGTYGIDLKKAISASVPDPATDIANNLKARLNARGISVESSITGRELVAENVPIRSAEKILDTYTSPTLEKIVYWFNQKSINLYGEHLVKSIALKQGKEATTPDGVEAIKDFWNKKLGIDKDAMNIYDGSGLSPANRITTMSMAQILQSLKKEPWFGSYYESLPVYNNMRMKSGSISDVIAYAGYQTSSTGTPLVFSVMMNNYSGSSSSARQKLFSMLDVLK